MRTRTLSFALLALTAALAGAAQARPGADAATTKPARDPEAIFKRLDTDHDGLVSKTEFAVLAQRVAERREKNGKAGKGGKGGGDGSQLFEKLDADHDGSLSPEEFKKIAELRKERGGGDATTRPTGRRGGRTKV